MPPTKRNRSYRDVYHGEVVKCLHNHNAFTRSQETGKFAQTEPGSADIMVHLNGGCAVEVKTATNESFSFSEWRDNQRLWAEDYEKNTHNIYWLAIMFETAACPWKSLRNPRHLFLVPRTEVLYLIGHMPQASLPYMVKPGMLKEIQSGNFDALHIWRDFGCSFEKGAWTIPMDHPFYTAYIDHNEELKF